MVIPGTDYRRVILAATAQLPENVSADVYCNHLSSRSYAIAPRYTGQ